MGKERPTPPKTRIKFQMTLREWKTRLKPNSNKLKRSAFGKTNKPKPDKCRMGDTWLNLTAVYVKKDHGIEAIEPANCCSCKKERGFTDFKAALEK